MSTKSRRKKNPKADRDVLLKSRRRCCLCFGLNGDIEEKKGQIAHLDRDRANDKPGNLAFLCFAHHDQYDSTTSQSKSLQISEVRAYREKLYQSFTNTKLHGSETYDKSTLQTQRKEATEKEIEKEYDKLILLRGIIHTGLAQAYSDFRSDQPNLPKDVKDFFLKAGLPLGIDQVSNIGSYRVPENSPDIHFIAQDFIFRIYPVETSSNRKQLALHSLVKGLDPLAKEKDFNHSRSVLGAFWNRYGLEENFNIIRNSFSKECALMIALSWLDISHRAWTNESHKGKRQLFKTAQKLLNVINDTIKPEHADSGSMYNLLVSSSEDAWDGTPTTLPTGRCLKPGEYTSTRLAEEYGDLTPDQVADLMRMPSIFACETGCNRDARLGRITGIRKRRNEIRVEYELCASYPPISNEELLKLKWELGIEEWELCRTHWALKGENLSASLAQAGFLQITFVEQPLINIHNHVFDVALSFPGEVRDYVETVARHLVDSLGPNRVFYDNFYKAQLAVPNLDTALQALYRERARLVVAFLSKDYASKKWCGIEFKAIREILNERNDEMVMYVRHDSTEIAGVFSHDGYIDANAHSEIEIAAMINERIQLLDSTTS